MKKLLNIVLLTFLILFILVVGLVTAAFFLEDRITRLAIEKVGETIEAPFGVESAELSFIRVFPLATLQLNGVWLGAPLSAEGQAVDTLVRFDKLYVSVLSRPLLDTVFNVRRVEAHDGQIRYHVSETGATNFDFLMGSDSIAVDTTSSGEMPTIFLKRINLKDIRLLYSDDQRRARAEAYIPEARVAAQFDSLVVKIETKGELRLKNCAYADTPLDRMKQADMVFDLLYDQNTLTVKGLDLKTEGAALKASGSLEFGDQTALDLSLVAKDLNLTELKKYVPDSIFRQYEISQTSGLLSLEATLKGIVSESEMPRYDVRFDLSKGTAKWQQYPLMRDIRLRGSITNGQRRNNATTALSISTFHVKTGANQLDLSGSLRNFDRLQYDLKTQLEIDLASSRVFVPDTLVKDMKGHISAHIDTRGVLPDSINAEFADYLLQNSSADFRFQNVDIDLDSGLVFKNLSGQLGYRDHVFHINGFNIYLPQYEVTLVDNVLSARYEGKIADLAAWSVDWPYCYVKTPRSSLKGVASVQNFAHPSFSIESEVHLDLADVKPYVPDSLLNDIAGMVDARIESSGMLHLDSLAQQLPGIIYDHTTIDLYLNSISLDMPDTLMNVQQLTGDVQVNSREITTQKLSGVYSGVNFSLESAVVKNLFTTVLKNRPGKLEVLGVLRLSQLDYGMLGAFLPSDTAAAESVEKVPEPKEKTLASGERWNGKYEIKGKLFVNSLKYENAVVTDISTLFNIQDSLYIIDQLKFHAFEGSMNSSARVEFKPDGETHIYLKNQTDRMNIRTLLHDLDNFDLEDLTYENISGIISTEELDAVVKVIGDSILLPSIQLEGDLKLEGGGVYNYGPVEALASSIPGIDRLDTLMLRTVNSHVFILQSAVFVPRTYIVSNVMDISAFGMQSFGEDYNYLLEVYLRDVVRGKSNKIRRRQAAQGDEVVERKKKPLSVKSYSLDGKYRSGLATKDEKEQMTNAIKAREAWLKLRFNPKIVNYRTGVEESLGAQ